MASDCVLSPRLLTNQIQEKTHNSKLFLDPWKSVSCAPGQKPQNNPTYIARHNFQVQDDCKCSPSAWPDNINIERFNRLLNLKHAQLL